MSTWNYTTSAEALQEIPDPRKRQGQRFEWSFLLFVTAAAMLCGHSQLFGRCGILLPRPP